MESLCSDVVLVWEFFLWKFYYWENVSRIWPAAVLAVMFIVEKSYPDLYWFEYLAALTAGMQNDKC